MSKPKDEDGLAIEELQKNLNVDAQTLEAVMKANGWKAGERVSEADFKKEVEAYSNSLKKNSGNVLAIEEHKKTLNIDAPVFAAVMQTKGWGSGKKVPEAVFKKAVEDFLGAPMGGK